MKITPAAIEGMREKWRLIAPQLDERSRRVWAGVEALAYGHGGVTLLHLATGMSRLTISKGKVESQQLAPTLGLHRMRAKGGGRKLKTEQYPDLAAQLEGLIQPHTKGDPMGPLRWTSKSTYRIATQLGELGYSIHPGTVGSMLRKQGYSLQLNVKEKEGKEHGDRDAQFRFINERVSAQLASGGATISVDTKKKELVGNYKNGGREYHAQGEAPRVNVHDFADQELGKAAPYGVYDVRVNQGWVSVGVSSDTATFAVNSIREWWYKMGRQLYQGMPHLLITADGGGSNSSRSRLWKVELQGLANELGMSIGVSHLPPGTSKWNKIEHKMFCFISQNWRGKPLITLQTIVQLIAHTTTRQGLKIMSALDEREYAKGVKVSDAEMAALNLTRDDFHGEWNYTISPNSK
ncbi:ISAzo13 family transposase [Neolewinella sp.]|uniref:ISAzo13 family transposase n=1 Tax=Neolewinella sp. TaxID=2993543 RepID=UPI003B52B9A5